MDTADRRLRVAAARAGYLSSGDAPTGAVSDFVAASWYRSHAAGVAPDSGDVPYLGDVDISSRLLRCARPIVERLIGSTEDIPLSVALSDGKARVLTRVDTSRTIGLLLDQISLAPGFDYAEGHIGTNGVGTVLESGKSVHIVGPEHFHERFQPYSCSGSPIHDPLTGRIEGVLDLTCLTEHSTPLLHSFVRSAAKDIERSLLSDRSVDQQALFDAFIRIDYRSRSAVFAIGERVMMANALAQSAFDPIDQRTIAHHARYLMGSRRHADDEIELPDGRVVRLKGTRISAGSEIAGIVVEVDTVREARPRIGSPGAVASVVLENPSAGGGKDRPAVHAAASAGESHSPLWRRASGDVATALTEHDPLLVMGEDGTGKFSLIAETYHRLFPGSRTIQLDSTDFTDDRPCEGMLQTPTSTIYILRRIQDFGSTEVARVRAFLDKVGDSDPSVWIAATMSDTSMEENLPFRDVLPYFHRSVQVPPLRHRIDDLSPIVDQVLRRLTNGRRRTTVSSAAMRAMARYSWPGNVRQLEEALRTALAKRPVGEIQPEDLPGYCYQSSGRVLTAIESVERDAIVTALQDAGGNRVQAAANLGIARSSLYRKLKSFGIDSL